MPKAQEALVSGQAAYSPVLEAVRGWGGVYLPGLWVNLRGSWLPQQQWAQHP